VPPETTAPGRLLSGLGLLSRSERFGSGSPPAQSCHRSARSESLDPSWYADGPEQFEDWGEQLLLYSKLASEISPGKKIATRFLVLTKTKEPVIEEHVREVEPGNVNCTLAGVERVWRAIESGVFYPAPSVMSCSSCGYREACRAWAG